MKRATIELDDELDQALAAYGQALGVGDDSDAAADAALRAFLLKQGYLISNHPLLPPRRMTPLHRDDGPTDVSTNIDKYSVDFADWESGRSR